MLEYTFKIEDRVEMSDGSDYGIGTVTATGFDGLGQYVEVEWDNDPSTRVNQYATYTKNLIRLAPSL